MKTLVSTCIFLLLGSTVALADAIDGDWCSPAGAHILIDGPTITLSGGDKLMGKYRRHEFSYIAPQGDSEAGKEILFVMRSEEEMRRVRDPQAMPEHSDIWRRCQNISSTGDAVPLRDDPAISLARS